MNEEIEKLDKKISFQLSKIEEIPEVIKRRKTIHSLVKSKGELINACKHKNALALYEANTGNYDPSSDSYWVNVFCPDCDRRFYFDSTEEGYRRNYKEVNRYNKKEVSEFNKLYRL